MYYKISQAIAIAAAIASAINTTLIRIIIYSEEGIFNSPWFGAYQASSIVFTILQLLLVVLVAIHLWRVPQQSLFGQKLRIIGILIIIYPIMGILFNFFVNFIFNLTNGINSLRIINLVLGGLNLALWGGLIAFSLSLPDTNAEEKNLKYSFIFLAVVTLFNFALSWIADILYQILGTGIPSIILLGLTSFVVGMMYFLILRRLSAWREVAIPKYQGDDDLLYKQQKMLDQPEQAAK